MPADIGALFSFNKRRGIQKYKSGWGGEETLREVSMRKRAIHIWKTCGNEGAGRHGGTGKRELGTRKRRVSTFRGLFFQGP